ncbi:MAG: DUF1289 domain-containing protein [Pseudomonadota bacterium]
MSTAMIASPCTGICKLDETTGWCLGCGRSGEEIAVWGMEAPAWRDSIWAEIPQRLSDMGVVCQRLPWSSDDIRRFVVRSLESSSGTWVMGVVGAVAEFTAKPGADVSVRQEGDTIVAKTDGGALSMRIDDSVRAMTFDPVSTPENRVRIVLAVKRERGRLPMADGVSDLGEDTGALIASDGGDIFDLGLGRKEARFCVRVAQGKAREALEAVSGLGLAQSLPSMGPALLSESPTRVVETALGRTEVQGPIAVPGGPTPSGPHTHLLPDHLATMRAMPVSMDLPRAYLPGAIFYPRQDG